MCKYKYFNAKRIFVVYPALIYPLFHFKCHTLLSCETIQPFSCKKYFVIKKQPI